ncbi:hypothetical protein GLOIN_2v1481557 [Rhizophagus clarus]|uniref:Uncharacterized protein n=1 Tax=Rhizophagus clarus TaxID=94130 RepID=A0A8H3KUC4_9GLOM|nr:hypothetical protein GLOIN_2v1481557 [Rhizophagus clarus]
MRHHRYPALAKSSGGDCLYTIRSGCQKESFRILASRLGITSYDVINIPLACLYHGVPTNVLNPPPPLPPQVPPPNPIATIPNPIPIDLFDVRFAILNCIV